MSRSRTTLFGLAAAAVLSLTASGSALAATATQQVNAGSLSFINSTPGDVTFPPLR